MDDGPTLITVMLTDPVTAHPFAAVTVTLIVIGPAGPAVNKILDVPCPPVIEPLDTVHT